MGSREAILKNIRQSIEGSDPLLSTVADRQKTALRRVDLHPRGIVPDRTSNPERSSIDLFYEKVEASSASLAKVESYGDVGPAISEFLRLHNLPQRVRMGDDNRLSKLGWSDNTSPEILKGPSDGNDLVCVSHAQGGVSETGTLILTSGNDNPTTLNFLSENHIIVVQEKTVRKCYEGMWKTLRRKFGKGKLPRTVNMITGPSRSADIEQTLIFGAHGPLRVHVIVVDN